MAAERKIWFKTASNTPETIKVTITPEIAGALIDQCYEKQRPRSQATVDRYIGDMKKGKWDWAASGSIKLDKDGKVIDGQHRLWAIFLSGVTIQSWVTIGLETKSYVVIDTGKSRSASDVLGDVKYKAGVISIAKFRLAWDRGVRLSAFSTPATNTDVVEYFARHPETKSYAARAAKVYNNIRLPKAILGGFISIAYEYNPIKAAEFVSCLESGEGLLRGHPALEARNRIIFEYSGKTRPQSSYALALIIKAFNAYLKGSTVKTLRLKSTERFPEIGQ
jgi:hypothetical protein